MAGLNNAIFDLPNRLEDIRRPEDTIKIYTRKVIPKSASTSSSFPGSDVVFDFSLSANQYWLPSRSFIVIKDVIIAAGANPFPARKPLLIDPIAPSFNLPLNLFDGFSVTAGGFSLGSRTKLSPQIAACEARLSKSGSYLDKIARTASTWKPSFGARKQDIVLNGQVASDFWDEEKLVGTITLVAGSTALVGVGTAFLTDLQPGNLIRSVAGQAVHIRTITDNLNATTTSDVNTPEAGVAFYRVSPTRPSSRANNNERIFQPPLGIFKQGKALPPARYEVTLTPKPDIIYKQSALEASDGTPTILGGDRSAGPLAAITDVEYIVENIVFYVAVVEAAERPPDKMTYVLDLEETEVQTRQINGGGNSTENFTVSKSTFGLSVALQDLRAGQNPLFSPSLFKTENDEQQSLTSLRIDYAGQTRPNPAKSLALTVGVVNSNDFQTWGWGESAVESLGWYDTGGNSEDKDTWRQLGELYHYQFRKTGDDISTDVNVDTTYGAFASARNLLLFHHFRRVVEFTVENNQVVKFLAQDA